MPRFSNLVLAVALVASAAGFELVVSLKQQNLDAFESLFWEISTPGSPEYLQHRSPAEIAAIIGASDNDIASVQTWLKQAGGQHLRISPLRDQVMAEFTGAHTLTMTPRGLPHKATHPAAVESVLRRDAKPEALARKVDHDVHHKEVHDVGGEKYSIQNIKKAYGIPVDLQASNDATTQMVWGPGTFGYSPKTLKYFKATQCPLLNLDKVKFDTKNHGESGGDNFGEGELDTKMITSFGLNVNTLVSNTNTTASTEETTGFGAALFDFVTELALRPKLPHVLSMSLGSLSAGSCELLCEQAATMGHTLEECQAYIATQRQVCMFLSEAQTTRINTAFQVLGARGVTVLGSSGDGGSHFSFGRFSGGGIATTLNTISCKFQIPVFPTASPYVISVGGEQWGASAADPTTWAGFGGGSGGGFSIQFPAPAHQAKAVAGYLSRTHGLPPAAGFNASMRAYPDLAAVGVSGTSQSCPIFAGIFSMITDARLNAGLPPLGFVGPRIYQVAEQHPGEAFEDITSGDSNTSCDNGFPAAVGWDPDTGVGRPVWAGLLRYFGSDSNL